MQIPDVFHWNVRFYIYIVLRYFSIICIDEKCPRITWVKMVINKLTSHNRFHVDLSSIHQSEPYSPPPPYVPPWFIGGLHPSPPGALPSSPGFLWLNPSSEMVKYFETGLQKLLRRVLPLHPNVKYKNYKLSNSVSVHFATFSTFFFPDE